MSDTISKEDQEKIDQLNHDFYLNLQQILQKYNTEIVTNSILGMACKMLVATLAPLKIMDEDFDHEGVLREVHQQTLAVFNDAVSQGRTLFKDKH